ncbi:MAG: DnaJ domain-containing protein [Candidatus Dormibacteraeota bacterium]|nr:DnaJ domain-containing protein [Candidatus Dormibacteraeota bacterium]
MPRRHPAEFDAYDVLGAQPSDSWTELRRHYRARARELHPDVQAQRHEATRLEEERATRLFTRLQAAWALVDTPERRAAYDLRRRPAPPKRPLRAPSWPFGPVAGVLLRAGPGDLHIAVPGGGWDLSLAKFAAQVELGAAPALLIGDLPPHREVREALLGLPFIERGRLAAMVGLEVPFEERADSGKGVDDEGAWKLDQVRRCLGAWAAAGMGGAGEVPYRRVLLLMGRLSLRGFELNLPHPAGLTQVQEARPRDRAEAAARRGSPLLQLLVPPPSLILAAAFSGDLELRQALAAGWFDPHRPGGASPALLRFLSGRRPRADHHEPLWGSTLDSVGPDAAGPAELRRFSVAFEWLVAGTVPDRLPWGDAGAECGRDRRLGDHAARLMAVVIAALEGGPGQLVSLKGNLVTLRLSDPKEGPLAAAAAEQALERAVGFGVAVGLG